MSDPMILTVRSGQGTLTQRSLHHAGDGFTDEIETIERTPRQHSGWQSITYKGKRYQLMGGIRTNFWINLTLPIKGRQ